MTPPAEDVARLPWYHTIDLPGGIVTPGRWDTRHALRAIPFPATLNGKRCLDVGTWDGFWAFEMEKRGAREVVALDLADAREWDWPASARPETLAAFGRSVAANRAFALAHTALGSAVERLEASVYELSQDRLGTFDFVFVGSLLIHLRDPARGLAALRPLVRGELLSADQVSLSLSLLRPRRAAADLAATDEPFWWTPNLAAHRRLVEASGFEVVAAGGPYRLRPGPGAPHHVSGLRKRLVTRFGLPHAWVLARPSARHYEPGS